MISVSYFWHRKDHFVQQLTLQNFKIHKILGFEWEKCSGVRDKGQLQQISLHGDGFWKFAKIWSTKKKKKFERERERVVCVERGGWV